MLDWPMRDGLLAYVERLREDARAQYRTDCLVWAALAPHTKKPGKPPALPRLLQGD